MECLVVRHTQSFYTEQVILALKSLPSSSLAEYYGVNPPRRHLVFSFPAHLFLFLCFEFTNRTNLLKTLIPFLWGAAINTDEALLPCLLLTSWYAAGFITDHRPGPVPVHAWPRSWETLLYYSVVLHLWLFPTQPFLLEYQENRKYFTSVWEVKIFSCVSNGVSIKIHNSFFNETEDKCEEFS